VIGSSQAVVVRDCAVHENEGAGLRRTLPSELCAVDNLASRRNGEPDSYQRAARTIAALLTLRDQVIAPILAGVRSPRRGRKPKAWTAVDRDYEQIRIDMQTLFGHLALSTVAAAA